MYAFRGYAYGPPDALRWEEIPDPALAEGQVRIEIKASAVNFPDVLYIAGNYQVKPTPPFTPGFEVAGVVVESRAPSLPEGARVCAVLDGGGYATHAVAAASCVFQLPDTIPLEDAAAMTTTYQTGWFALHRRARIARGDWLLVHAGAGGVGSAALQLGKAAGAKIIATAGGAKKTQVCRELGADVAIDYTAEDFVPIVKAATLGRGADVIVDPVGGDVFDRSTKCIAFEGRIVVVGFTQGRFPEVRANHVLVKNYSVLGLHWGLYNQLDPVSVVNAQRELYRLYEERTIKPLISERRALREAPTALERVASRQTVGKIILTP